MAALDWLQSLLGGAPSDDQGAAYAKANPQTGVFEPYTPPTPKDALQQLYELSGSQDMQQAYQAYQRGEYLPAFGQGAYGAFNAASLAAPAVGGAMRAGGALARAGAPIAREAPSVLSMLMGDEAGTLRIRPPRLITLGQSLPAVEEPTGILPTAMGHNLGPRLEPEPLPMTAMPAQPPQVAPTITGREPTFGETLRAGHLDRENPLPLAGARMPVTPPAHITNEAELNAAVEQYVNYALQGQAGKNWYEESGRGILEHAGSPDLATPFAAGLARTSPQTDVASNLTHAVTIHNQYMAGDPLKAGRFPNAMGKALEAVYRQGEPITGEKIGPFMGAVAAEWDPTLFPHNFVNDIWNMRGLEYPGPGGKLFEGSPTLGEHNFARIVADRARERLQELTGDPWSIKQVQASGWTGIKQAIEGTTAPEAAFNFNDALRRNYANLSWESAPGPSTGHFPEYFSAPWDVRQAYHDKIREALTDDQGRDIIARHLGLLTGENVNAPGYFAGQANPGTQTPVVVGQAPGGAMKGVDPASRELLGTGERVRALVLGQDAGAWNKPIYAGKVPPQLQDLADVTVGRPLTPDETVAIAKAMHEETGSDFHSPIATGSGFRFINVPDASGLSNKQFVAAVDRLMKREDILPGLRTEQWNTASDGFYEANDWKINPNGDTYKQGLGSARSPDLQRRAAELLATLGPRVSAVDDWAAQTHGWTPGRNRFWEDPAYQAFKLDTLPRAPRPGELRSTAEIGPGWRKLFGPGGVLPGLAVGGALGGSLLAPGSAEAAQTYLPAPQRPDALSGIMRMLGAGP